MANDNENVDAPEARDNAVDLTSGLVLATTLLLVVALWVVFTALKIYFNRGPMAG